MIVKPIDLLCGEKQEGIMKVFFSDKLFCLFLLVFFIGLLLCGKAEGANWKLFYKDDTFEYYYDKDSIHYPYSKKGWFGSLKTDKDIIGVWVIALLTDKSAKGIMTLEELDCKRRLLGIKEMYIGDKKLDWHFYWNTIAPNTLREALYNKLCK
jgi:hypothetical protein